MFNEIEGDLRATLEILNEHMESVQLNLHPKNNVKNLSTLIGYVIIKIYEHSNEIMKLFWTHLHECFIAYGKNFVNIVKTHIVDTILAFIGSIGDAIFNSIPVVSQLRGAINAILSIYHFWRIATFALLDASSNVAKFIGKNLAGAIALAFKSILGLLNIEGINEVFNLAFAAISVGMAQIK